MSAVTRDQYRRAWAFVRSTHWPNDQPSLAEVDSRCAFAGVDLLAALNARKVRACRDLSDPLTWPRSLRAASRRWYSAARKAGIVERLAA
jgi:hypothetical protein